MDIVQPVQAVLNTLENSALTILQLLDTILTNLEVSNHSAACSFIDDIPCCLQILTSVQPRNMKKWACDMVEGTYQGEMNKLCKKESRFHFTAVKATKKKLQDFSLNKATQKMKMLALDLWRLFRNLLSADEQLSYQKKFTQHKAEKKQLGTKRTWVDESEGGEQELGGTTTEVDNVDNWETVSDEGEILSGKPDMMNQRTYLNKRERKQTL